MASSCLSNDKRNFQCVTVASVDVIKLPLRDILKSHIQPADLFHKIKKCSTLKLRQDQLNVCHILPPVVPDYNKFDVTLLYTLIRNLCHLPCPTQGWGNEPKATDTQISDDIERLRLFRNNYYAHAKSAEISENMFRDIWRDLKLAINRIQSRCNVNYEDELTRIEQSKYTLSHWEECMTILNAFAYKQNQTDGRDEPDIFIQGENELICGSTARFEADVQNVQTSCWSITWQQRRVDVIKCIDTNMEKYNGSTKKTLVINSVCKEDEGEYQAVLPFESNGPDYKSRNTIRLHVTGETPFLNIFEATTRFEGITIQYNCGVSKHSPNVHHIEWSKNGQPLQHDTKKYVGGGVDESCFTITSPTNEDKGNYSCKVTNAVGSVSKDIMLDVPSVQISVDSQVCCGSETTIKSVVSSTPTPEKIEWQKSKNGIDFFCISKPDFFEIDDTFTCPFFLLPKTTFDDKLYYRLLVWNGIGESVSNIVYLNITGSTPNITTSLETNVKNRSVKLMGNVVIYDNSPAIVKTFWTRNGEEIRFDTDKNGGELLEANTDNPSLTIRNVSFEDAGEYQLTAINAVGSSTSDVIALAIPSAFVEKSEHDEKGGQRITVAIKSFPAPCLVQWSAKCKNEDIFKPIDINAEEYKGTTVSFPHPVLVVRQADLLDEVCFRLDVTNFIGKTRYEISGNISPVVPISPEIVENTLYKDHGASVRFTKLNNILVRQFPHQKFKLLKFLLTTSDKIKNRTSVVEAKTTLDCLTILQDENLFTQTDVIFMQFLCRETNCLDLYEKCIEYAEKQRALCYFEKNPVNGYVDVQFHVQGELSGYSKEYIQEVIDTVAAILDCDKGDILLNGVRHSKSFLLSLSVNAVYSWKLSALKERDRLKLSRLNIDYLMIGEDIIDLQGSTDSVLTKDFEYNLKDLVLCDLCETLSPSLRCAICNMHLCKTCIGEHLSDKSKEHRVVPFISRRTKYITKCLKHTSEYCDNYCIDCDISVCTHCTSGIGHRGHKYIEMDKKLEGQKDILQRDLQELEKLIYPKYQEIASIIPIQKADLKENSKKITATIDEHGEDLHRKVDSVIRKLKSDVYEINTRYLSVLNKQENKIKKITSEIQKSIAYMKKLLYSNEDSLVSGYKSRNAEFRIFPPKSTVSLLRFTPKKLYEEQISQQFGSLSAPGFSMEIEEHGFTIDPPSAKYSTTNRPLIDEPRIVTEINTGNAYGVHSVSCVTDEHIWTCSLTENTMKLYNLQGDLVESIQTKSRNCPRSIAVTRDGNLVYTDYDDRTVNILKNTQIQTVIRLQEWSPLSVCCASAGDLLVALVNNHFKPAKIVRYSGFIEKQTIENNDKGIPLFQSGSFIKHISENRNLDLCVADKGAGAVVVVNQFGKLRFTYTGPSPFFTAFPTKRSFDPDGITTDSQSRILIADHNNQRIHILDQNGQFLRYIDSCRLKSPRGLCVDSRDNLFVTEFSTNQVKKIQYCIQTK